MKARYTVYSAPGSNIQLRDSKPDKYRKTDRGIVAVFPTLGGGYVTWQTQLEAMKLARKIARLLNAPR